MTPIIRQPVSVIDVTDLYHPHQDVGDNFDLHAFVGLLRSGLSIDIYPCATNQGPFDLGANNSFWSMPDLRWVNEMDPPLRRYLGFALQRVSRMDFLRAMDEDWPGLSSPEAFRTLFGWEHKVWETAVWQNITGRKLVRRADGSSRIVRVEDIRSDDHVVRDEMISVALNVGDDGHFDAKPTSQDTPFRLYYRPDPAANQAALQDALPALYLSFRTPGNAGFAQGTVERAE